MCKFGKIIPHQKQSALFLLLLFASVLSFILFSIYIINCKSQNILSNNHPSNNSNTTYTQKVCFSPGYCCKNEILKNIKNSNNSIFVAMYAFFDKDIASALVSALKKGVAVFIVVDQYTMQDQFGKDHGRLLLNNLQNNGAVIVVKGSSNSIFHNKYAIFDEKIVVTGSYNWTVRAAKNNYENCIFLSEPEAVNSYVNNMKYHLRTK